VKEAEISVSTIFRKALMRNVCSEMIAGTGGMRSSVRENTSDVRGLLA
jgi:hypothetical protein